jgi:rod shape-determining protein MreD
MVIYIAITSDKTVDIFIAFTLGYLYDIFSGTAVGLFAMLRTITFVITRFLTMRFFSKNALFFIIVTFIISIFDSIYLGYKFSGDSYGFLNILGNSIYISIINSVTAVLMYPLLVKIEGLYSKIAQEPEGRY